MSDAAPSDSRLPVLSPGEFQAITGVGSEAIALLRRYEAVLRDWNARMNLVSAASLADVWRRHFLDSAQLAPLTPPTATTLLDFGSGAGLPGLVLAILLHRKTEVRIHLVESVEKKCAFLRAAATELGFDDIVTVHRGRIEDLAPFRADVVTARAVAALETLLRYAQRFAGKGALCLFPKGRTARDELTRAGETWRIEAKLVRSLSDPEGSIVAVQSFSFKGRRR